MKPKLTAALAKKAEQAAASKTKRLLAQATADIELIRRRRAEITEAFYDIGEALVRLKKPEVVRALGCSSFGELCESKLELSVATATRLIDIVNNLTRAEAVKLGQSRANALIGLSDATPEHDTASSLARKRKLALPSGRQINVVAASSRQLEDAATEIRRSRKTAAPKGRTVPESDGKAAAALQAALRKLGARKATVEAVATKPGAAAEIRIAGLTVAQLPLLRKAAPQRTSN